MTETETPPQTVAEFLKARLDEDEAMLKFTTARGSWEPHRDYIHHRRGLVRHRPTGDVLAEFVYPADAEHAAHWQPSRVRAEIEAKREILRRSTLYAPDLIRLLASVYSDHPDYRDEWAVERQGVEW